MIVVFLAVKVGFWFFFGNGFFSQAIQYVRHFSPSRYSMRAMLIAAVAPMAASLLFVFAAYPWPCLAAYIGWALAGPIASTVLLAILVSR